MDRVGVVTMTLNLRRSALTQQLLLKSLCNKNEESGGQVDVWSLLLINQDSMAYIAFGDGRLSNQYIKECPATRLHMEAWNEWLSIFEEGLRYHNDDWIAEETNRRSLLKTHEERRKSKGGITIAKVPHNAAQQLAEGEFNRFYLRGICSRALDEGKSQIQIYRGKEVSNPRPESERKIGELIDASELLNDLRDVDFVDKALKLPAGPNSGLTAEIVK